MRLRRLQEEHKVWREHNFPNSEDIDPFLGIVEEVGELSHAILKARQGIRGTPAEHFEAKKDAVADILIYMADWANREGLDLETTLEDVWSEVKTRDWRRFPKNGRTE
jgi:NTP pyrophosphatase (non-canonical NTP hydrolase)